MPIRVLISDPIDVEGVSRLEKEGFEVDFRPTISKEDIERIIPGYDVLIVRSRTKVTRDMIERGKRLKVIGRAGAGVDNIDKEATEKKKVRVINTPEAPADSVAELTIGMMLALARRIPLADSSMKDGKWLKKELEGSLLKDKTLGLIGLGNIGLRVATIAKAIGMRILITKRTPPSLELLKTLEAKYISMHELLRQSDIVSIHVPLSEQTNRMIGPKELDLMKKQALLINTSRGAIVDEAALLVALMEGRLGGAALDVYECEPPNDPRLIKLPNVVCTPHIGAQTEETQKAASILLADKIIELFESNPS